MVRRSLPALPVPCSPDVLMVIIQPTAKQTPTSCQWHPEAMGTRHNSVGHNHSRPGPEPYSHSVRAGYVGFSPSLDTVIVAHQGTNPSEL